MLNFFKVSVGEMMSSIGGGSEQKKLRAAILQHDEEKALAVWQRTGDGKEASDKNLQSRDKPLIDPTLPFDLKKTSDVTPLHLASDFGMYKLCKAFLAYGGNPNILNMSEQTCLHALCGAANGSSARTEAGVVGDSDASIARLEVLNIFLQWRGDEENGYRDGISINRVDADGNSAIHYAAQNGLSAIVRGLVSAGAIISIVNKNQRTCCELAESTGFYQLSSMLELALLFSPADEGMEAFQLGEQGGADGGEGGRADAIPPIYCLDCNSMNSDDVEDHMAMLIRTGSASLNLAAERTETLLQLYEWDLNALLIAYRSNSKEVLEKAMMATDIVLGALEMQKMEKNRASLAKAAAAKIEVALPLPPPAPTTAIVQSTKIKDVQVAAVSVTANAPLCLPAVQPKPVDLDVNTCTDMDFLVSEEARLLADSDIGAAMVVRMRIEVVEALAITIATTATEDVRKSLEHVVCDVVDNALAEAVPDLPPPVPAPVPAVVTVVEEEAKEEEEFLFPECPICCEMMLEEANFDDVIQQARRLVGEGKEEYELCISDSSDGKGLTCCAGHSFCVSCWSQHVTSKVRDDGFADLSCPGFKCGEKLNKKWAPFLLIEPPAEQTATASPDRGAEREVVEVDKAVSGLLGRFRRARIQRFIDCNRACQNCLVEGCGMVMLMSNQQLQTSETSAVNEPLPQVVFCGAGHTMCMACRSEGHAPSSCANYLLWQAVVRKETGLTGTEKSGTLEVANDLWLSANTKKCPRCSTPIEKDEGCNHMVCSKCRHEFCWMCMEKWSLHSNTTGGYFQCNKYVEKNLGDVEEDKQTRHYGAKGSSRAETARLQMTARKMARFIHHFTRYSAHMDSARQEFAMRLETLKRIEYSLHKTIQKELHWLHEGRAVNPAQAHADEERDILKRLRLPSATEDEMSGAVYDPLVASRVRSEIEDMREEGQWEDTAGRKKSSSTASNPSNPSSVTSTPSRQRGSVGSLGSKISRKLSSWWFSPSKALSTLDAAANNRAVSEADAAYASKNFSVNTSELAASADPAVDPDMRNMAYRTDGPVYLKFLRDAFDELARSRQFLRGSYAHAYFAFEQGNTSGKAWRTQARMMDSQVVYEALQGELEFLVEMLSDVLARRRLRASQFQVTQLYLSVRAKRIEMENYTVNALINSQAASNDSSRDHAAGMTPLSAFGSLLGSGSSSGRQSQNGRGNRSSDNRYGNGAGRGLLDGLDENELVDMMSMLSQMRDMDSGSAETEAEYISTLLGGGTEATELATALSTVTDSSSRTSPNSSQPRTGGVDEGRSGRDRSILSAGSAGSGLGRDSLPAARSSPSLPPGFTSAFFPRQENSSSDSSDSDAYESVRPMRRAGASGSGGGSPRFPPSLPSSLPNSLTSTASIATALAERTEREKVERRDRTGNNSSSSSGGDRGMINRRELDEEVELQSALFMSLRQEPLHVPVAVAPPQESIDLLVQMMNVTADRAASALMQNGNNVEAAINLLLS